MSGAISTYSIGDELFRHIEGAATFRFTVQGIRKYEDSVQLEVECQTCTHGWKCRLLLAQNDYGKIVSVHMLNEDENDSQKHWHSNDGLHFWPTKVEAREEGLRALIRRADDRIKQKQDQLASELKYRDKLVSAIEDTP